MVYLVVFDFSDATERRATSFEAKLNSYKAEKVTPYSARLLETEKTAQELYLDLTESFQLSANDQLFVAQITANSIGSYFSSQLDAGRSIAALVGRAQRK